AVTRGDFLNDHGQTQVVEPGTIPLGWHGDAIATEFGQAAQFVLRKVAVAVPLRRLGRDVVLHVGANGVLHRAVVFAEKHVFVSGTLSSASATSVVEDGAALDDERRAFDHDGRAAPASNQAARA